MIDFQVGTAGHVLGTRTGMRTGRNPPKKKLLMAITIPESVLTVVRRFKHAGDLHVLIHPSLRQLLIDASGDF